ncbi:MAG: SpoIIE family protein phosphatase [Phycisphaerales bacterium]|nr:SpoIIE family protein phosphatase [Phycisphaerales bacterium]
MAESGRAGVPRSAHRQLPWRERLQEMTALMRHISTLTDPQDVVNVYGEKIQEINGLETSISISRRNLQAPWYKITRADELGDIDPWKNPEKLPVFDRGILGRLIYGEEPVIINDFQAERDDPAYEYMRRFRSLAALPHFDNGISMNMVVIASARPESFDPELLPDWMMSGNLFGRATNNLVLSRRLQAAYETIDAELKVVSDIQRSLLPQEFPFIPTLKLSSHYESSSRAGGDSYDFFPLGAGKYGIMIADVSGHGTPAAVLMAITHAISHLIPGGPHPPEHVMGFINRQLSSRYTTDGGSFVTAFYGVFDEHARTLTYANAGHPSPLWKCVCECDAGELPSDQAGLPLGIMADAQYTPQMVELSAGDAVLLYTDGISEARNPTGEMYGVTRLHRAMALATAQKQPMPVLVEDLRTFCAGAPAGDDRTMLLAQVR